MHVYAPPGFMPATSGGHGPVDIVLCTGHGPLTSTLDLVPGRKPAGPHHRHDLCPFSSAAPLAPASGTPAIPVAAAIALGMSGPQPATSPRRVLRLSDHGPRAPPVPALFLRLV